MTTKADILARGYLPKELPPVFSSATLGAQYGALPKSNAKESHCLRFSYSKYSSVRRAIAIPNPAHFVELADAVATNWALLQAHCQSSPISWTKPKSDSGRAIVWETSLEQLPILRAEQRVGARYLLQADVASCYSTMYTHAIPWALHTKATAKADRGTKKSISGGPPLAGNILDLWSRSIQSGQTVGIPIGPDTSLPLAEAILTEVDKRIESQLHCRDSSFRFVDDYEFAFASLADAERARNVLQDALDDFELRLNDRKTRIVELPGILDTSWTQDLAGFVIDSQKEPVLRSQIIRYFSKAFEFANAFPGDPVLKYAVRRLSEIDTRAASPTLQQLLFQVATVDPGTLHTVLYITFMHRKAGRPVAISQLGKAIQAIIVRHGALQHGGDLAWALWGAVVFNVKLAEPAIAALEAMTDPVAILMALFAESKGVFERSLQKSQWDAIITSQELFENRWMVTYEPRNHGWMSHIAADPASADPFFEAARRSGVQFMNPSVPLEIPAPSSLGEYA